MPQLRISLISYYCTIICSSKQNPLPYLQYEQRAFNHYLLLQNYILKSLFIQILNSIKMKKIYFALALCLAVIMMFIASCSKENQKVEDQKPAVTWEDWLKAPKIMTISDLKADVKVESGVLHFKSSNDLKNVTNFLRNAPKEEIIKWENTLSGFTSVHKYLDMVRDEFRSDSLNERIFSELKIRYSGKVKFIDKDQRIKQIIPNGSIYGRIIGLSGEYRIGKSIVLYYKGKVISIPDGDVNKLQLAKNSLQDNPKDGIFLHNLRVDDDIKSLKTRDTGHWNWNCSNNCPVYEYRSAEGAANGQYYWLTQEFDMLNNSCWDLFSDPYGNYPYEISVDVGVHIDIEHRRRRGWLIHYYTPTFGGFNWGFGWGVDMELNIGGTVFPAPYSNANTPSHQGGGWSWFESNSDLDFDITFWNGTKDGNSNQYANFFFNTCIRRTGLVSSSNNDPINIKNQQYCQDGVTTQ
jgi:hypothetical protein